MNVKKATIAKTNMKSEMRKIVYDDLTYLIEEWDQDITPNSLRISSVVIRRLLLENGEGLLRKVWRDLKLSIEPLITFNSLKTLLEKYPPVPISDDIIDIIIDKYYDQKETPIGFLHQILDPKSKILLSFAGGAKYQGFIIANAVLSLTGKPLDVKPYQEVLSLSKFIYSPCAVVFGQLIKKDELIRYVVNKKGGAHFDRKRDFSKSQGKKFALLDILNDHYQSMILNKEMDLIYFELLSIGQSLINSPDIQSLRDRLRN